MADAGVVYTYPNEDGEGGSLEVHVHLDDDLDQAVTALAVNGFIDAFHAINADEPATDTGDEPQGL